MTRGATRPRRWSTCRSAQKSSPTRDYFPDLYRTALQALQGVGARVLVTIGDQRDPGELGPLAPSVRVERLVCQAELMPHTAAMIGHGGAGSTLTALAAGVPMALVPMFADQPFNARRVAELGAAIALDGGPASLPALGQAVPELLSDARYRDGAVQSPKRSRPSRQWTRQPTCSRH